MPTDGPARPYPKAVHRLGREGRALRERRYCADLAREEAEAVGLTFAAPLMRDELREAMQATKEREG